MNHIAILILFVGGVGLTLADTLMKKWIMNGGNLILIAGIVSYIIALGFLVESFKFKNIAVANAICVGFNMITLVLISWLYFKETLSVSQLIGIALIVTGIVVLEVI